MYQQIAPHQAIVNLYCSLEHYKPTEAPEGCPCCVSPQASAQLVSRSLHELSEADLTPYWSKAITTWGSASDFKYFLPRLFELALRDGSFIDLPWLGAKLVDASWLSWPAAELCATRAVLTAIWSALLTAPPPENPYDTDVLDDLLGLVGAAEDDVAIYLEIFSSLPGPNPLLHVSHYLRHVPPKDLVSNLRSGFLEKRELQAQRFASWLESLRAAT